MKAQWAKVHARDVIRSLERDVFNSIGAMPIAQGDPAEKLSALLKPQRKGRQPAITDRVPLRKMILAAEADVARPITRLALRFLALTVVRPNELRGACWDEFEDLNIGAATARRLAGDWSLGRSRRAS